MFQLFVLSNTTHVHGLSIYYTFYIPDKIDGNMLKCIHYFKWSSFIMIYSSTSVGVLELLKVPTSF